MNLTNEQLQAFEKGEAVELTLNGIPCVVLRKEVYDRVKSIMEYDDSDDLPSPAALSTLVRETMAEDDANDPLLDSYREDDVRQMEPLLADLAPEDWEDASSYQRPPHESDAW